jgi:hypothetical protein
MEIKPVETALREIRIDPEEVLELGGWRTTSDNVAVAHVPFPVAN